MAERRPKRRRPTYRQHEDIKVREAWKHAVAEDSVLADWLELQILVAVDGHSEFEMGIAEGKRRLAAEIMEYVLTDGEVEVKKNAV